MRGHGYPVFRWYNMIPMTSSVVEVTIVDQVAQVN